MKNRRKWIQRQQEILSAARSEGRGLTAAEAAEFEALQRKIDSEPETPPDDGQKEDEKPTDSDDAGAAKAVQDERKRIGAVCALCRQTGMEPDAYIRDGSTLEQVREAALEHLIKHGAPVRMGGRDADGDNFRDAARDALLMQAGVELEKPAQGAEDYRGMGLRDLLIESMVRNGEGTATELLRRSRANLWDTAVRQFLSPTADFPAILDNAVNKSIVQQYQMTPATFELWTSKGSLSDFKVTKNHEYALGGGEFYKVSEGGELKHSTLQTELLPNRKLETYGTQFTMSREAFINDDIGFLAAMPAQYAQQSKRKINRQVYEHVFRNPAIFDGAPLFDAAHKNLISAGSAPSIAVLEKMIQMMGKQTDQFGESIMVEPAFIIVPVGWGMRVNQILGTAEIDVEGIGSHTVNVLNAQYRSKIRTVEEGALNVLAGENACPWFMAADPRLVKGIQVDYLNGVTVPTFRRSEKAGYLGFIWDIWLDWVVNEADFRGLLRNDGAKLNG